MVRSVRTETRPPSLRKPRWRVVEEASVTRAGWTRKHARAALENMLLRDGLDAQDGQHGKAYWVPSARVGTNGSALALDAVQLRRSRQDYKRTKGQIRKLLTPKPMGANIEFNEIVMSLMSHSFDAHRLHDKASRGGDVEDSPCCNADAIQIKGLVLSHGELEDDDGLSPMTGRHCTRRIERHSGCNKVCKFLKKTAAVAVREQLATLTPRVSTSVYYGGKTGRWVEKLKKTSFTT
ncbi:hypothetical protein BKA83DRAFT_4129968 [Pisolithus microcarpus]|nr:hypothetical protein BKA83DRAFT_4129968 [Pisolithus microcarpus]